VLVGGVVEHEFDHDAQVALMRGIEKPLEVVQRAVAGVHADVIRDVVAVVFERRGKERQQPEAGDAKALDVVELVVQPLEIADAVPVAITERLHGKLVDDDVLVPERIGRGPGSNHE